MIHSAHFSDSDSSVAKIDEIMNRLSAEEQKVVENSYISMG